ncbi:cryptochrome/photolyase family protein [Brevibacillus fluminis]|uniref:cryptochrome/photolyase family protein n=1 Tax=Brevibacillus fluminis TaxID=511487 RepID=UPI003F8C9161
MAVIVWFRRDLRVHDHAALYHAVETGEEILPVFVLDVRQEKDGQSGRKSQALFSALRSLQGNLADLGARLVIKRGEPAEVLAELAKHFGADKLFFNREYAPKAISRDEQVAAELQRNGIFTQTFKDMVLHEEGELLNKQGKPYVVFTPYKRAWLTLPKDKPFPMPKKLRAATGLESYPSDLIPALGGQGSAKEQVREEELYGERAARRRLGQFLDTQLAGYKLQRDLPAVDGTSRLSFALRTGTLSIRTVYHSVLERMHQMSGPQSEAAETFVSELIWRDFYQQVLFHFPHTVEQAFLADYEQVEWDDNEELFRKWCTGQTGYPMVDAGMRQLNQTGWIHNRVRMITASFLVKDLLIDWRKGMNYFAEQLIDHDEAANCGGWQWCASTGTDAQPYFRIFNPVSQGEKFDPDGTYVKQYVPELAHVPAKYVHKPWTMPELLQKESACMIGLDYPPPCVDHAISRLIAIERFSQAKKLGNK